MKTQNTLSTILTVASYYSVNNTHIHLNVCTYEKIRYVQCTPVCVRVFIACAHECPPLAFSLQRVWSAFGACHNLVLQSVFSVIANCGHY